MKYIYSGPPSGVSLNNGGVTKEVLLFPGQTVDLEPDNEYTRTLLAEGRLTEVPTDKVPVTSKASTKGATGDGA
ncbi:TPA: hypothetical protein ACWV4V_003148 [Salmonella enterica subsp. enterica serovar Muenchen]